MVSGGLGATDGGSSDARASTGTRAFGGPSSEANQSVHLNTQSTAYTPRYIHPARAVGRRGLAARAKTAAPNPGVESIENPPATEDLAGPVGRERWVGRYQAGLIRFGYPTFEIHSGIYVAVAAALPLAWVAVVGFNRAYEGRFVGAGSAEFE